MSLTDLDSSEDTVYVVLSTDQHWWRRDRRVTVIAVGMSATGQRGKISNKINYFLIWLDGKTISTKFRISKISKWSDFDHILFYVSI